jgi:hypothetical protein
MRRRNESTRKGDETGVATGEREPNQMTSARSSDAALLRRWRKTARANDPSESVHELWRGLTGIKNAEAGSSGGRQGYQSQPRTAHRGRYALKGTKPQERRFDQNEAGEETGKSRPAKRGSNPAQMGLPAVPASADCFGSGAGGRGRGRRGASGVANDAARSTRTGDASAGGSPRFRSLA